MRIAVKGTSGAGKTTLARALAQRLALPYLELDALHHGPGWQECSAAKLQERVLGLLDDTRGWVVDGNYDGKLGSLVVDRAELIVWLDLPLPMKLARLAWRTGRRIVLREELWNGNRERLSHHLKWDPEGLFVWAVRQHFRHRREWPARFAQRPHVRLRTPRAVAEWLHTLPVAHGPT